MGTPDSENPNRDSSRCGGLAPLLDLTHVGIIQFLIVRKHVQINRETRLKLLNMHDAMI